MILLLSASSNTAQCVIFQIERLSHTNTHRYTHFDNIWTSCRINVLFPAFLGLAWQVWLKIKRHEVLTLIMLSLMLQLNVNTENRQGYKWSLFIYFTDNYHHHQCLVYKNKTSALCGCFLVVVLKGFTAKVFAREPVTFMKLGERPQPPPEVSFRLLKKHKTASWGLTYKVSAHISRNHCNNHV